MKWNHAGRPPTIESAAMMPRGERTRIPASSARHRLSATASGLAITVVLALLGLAALGGVVALLVFMVVAMPLTTAAVAAALLLGGFAAWRAKRRR